MRQTKNRVITRNVSKSNLLEGNLNVRLPPEPSRLRQALGFQELRIEQLRLVTRPVVAEHGNDGMAGAELAREPDRAGDVDARRSAETQTFVLEQIEDERHGFFV